MSENGNVINSPTSVSPHYRKQHPFIRKSTSSSYVFHHPTPHPLSSTPTHDSTIPLETNVTLSSTKSNKKSHSVFTFDEQNVYSQHPTFVSDPRNANPLVVQEITGELEERKVNVVDDYLRMTLHRVKDEAQLSEVEYGKLIMMIECGQLVGICDLLEDCLLKHDFTTIYQLLYKDDPIVTVTNEEPSYSSPHLTLPLTITDIGAEDLPSVFLYDHMLCCSCLIKKKRKWEKRFVTISEKAICVYATVQSWRLREDPIQFISFCSTMSLSDEHMDHSICYRKLEDAINQDHSIFSKWKKHVTLLKIGSESQIVEKYIYDAMNRSMKALLDDNV